MSRFPGLKLFLGWLQWKVIYSESTSIDQQGKPLRTPTLLFLSSHSHSAQPAFEPWFTPHTSRGFCKSVLWSAASKFTIYLESYGSVLSIVAFFSDAGTVWAAGYFIKKQQAPPFCYTRRRKWGSSPCTFRNIANGSVRMQKQGWQLPTKEMTDICESCCKKFLLKKLFAILRLNLFKRGFLHQFQWVSV